MKQLLAAIVLSVATQAQAYIAKVHCSDRDDATIFAGFVFTDYKMKVGSDQENVTIDYAYALSAVPEALVDRRTLERRSGVVLPACRGPYAKVFSMKNQGRLACAKANVLEIAGLQWNKIALLKQLGMPQSEIDCSTTLDSILVR